jgi:hypothetical protein
MRPRVVSCRLTSLGELAVQRGRALASLGLHRRATRSRLCQRLMDFWGRASLAKEPEWLSNVVDDALHSSIPSRTTPAGLRLLFEPLGSPPSARQHRRRERCSASWLRDYAIDLSLRAHRRPVLA